MEVDIEIGRGCTWVAGHGGGEMMITDALPLVIFSFSIFYDDDDASETLLFLSSLLNLNDDACCF